jgi:hypothetical protein
MVRNKFKTNSGIFTMVQSVGAGSPKAKRRPIEKEMIVLDEPSYIMIDPCGAI